MINAKMIARIMGALFFIEAGFLILCSFLAVYYNESDISAFLYSAAITAGAGSIAALAGKNAEKRISRRDGYVIVTLAWVFFSLFGMLPFYLSGYIPINKIQQQEKDATCHLHKNDNHKCSIPMI
jgi:trk system potassium uptake protein